MRPFLWGFILSVLGVTSSSAQLLNDKPVSSGGDPIGTWEAKEVPIGVYASPELLATVVNLQFTGTISGQLSLDATGQFEADYITTSSASLSVLIFGIATPFSFDIADTNRTTGTYSVQAEKLILTPNAASIPPDTLDFTVSGNSLTIVQKVPLGEFEGTVNALAPQSGGPIAVFEMTRVQTGYTGPITADFDGSGRVDFPDFLSFAQQFGKGLGDIGFDAKFDLDGSGRVDFGDFVSFAQQFGLDA